jgi:hypothetical protein
MPETTQRPLRSVEVIRRDRGSGPFSALPASAVPQGLHLNILGTDAFSFSFQLPPAHVNSMAARVC